MAAALIGVFLFPLHAEEDPAVVQVEGGRIRGAVGNGLVVFKGIPFARPPVGSLRWRPPQPVASWEGIRETTAFSPNPIQPKDGGPTAANTSEDCLYANVWRPAEANGPLPVMVWIYGGGLVTGGASLYPGDALAKQGILVVSFNYRLGRLGFFTHPALAREAPEDLRGNYGYMDQLAALQWVQRNIAAFGGDPKNVTLSGESAGGGSVLVHLTSPLSRGLFQRAILESPGIPAPRAAATPMRSLAAAESIAMEYARVAGIQGDDAAVLKGLRDLSVDELGKGAEHYVLAIQDGPEIPGLSHSIVDGRLVVEPPETSLREGRQQMIPVLCGGNDYDLSITPAATKDALFSQFGVLSPQARELYDPEGAVALPDLRQAVMADLVMLEPPRYLAQAMTRAGQPAYLYRFSYVPQALRSTMRGATHASEILFAWDCVGAALNGKATAEDEAMAKTTSGYWVSFVKTGDPNGGGRPNWPRHDPASPDVMNFTLSGPSFAPDPLKARLDLCEKIRK
ncbi:MAG: carboxylesterase family protein [Luteolibacter sp.]